MAESLSVRSSAALALSQSESPSGPAYLRRRGRDFINSLYGTLRAIKLYPLEHTAVQRSLAELAVIAREIMARERDLEFRVAGEFLFINAVRLRLDLTNYASFGYLLRVCRESGVGAISVQTSGVTEIARISHDFQIIYLSRRKHSVIGISAVRS